MPAELGGSAGRRRVCMVVHAYYPLAEPRVQREAGAARDAGLDVTVLALRGDGEPAEETVDRVQVRRVNLEHKRGAGLLWMLFEYVAFAAIATAWLAWQSIKRPFEIVHFHNPPDFLIVAGLIPRLRGSRLILDIHDLSSHMFGVRVHGRLGRIVGKVLVWMERRACGIADEVVTVHEPYRRELVDHGVPSSKLHIVMNSVDEQLLARVNARRAAPAPGKFRIAYHGTLTWWYGVDLIIDAVARLRDQGLDVSALILGDGDALPDIREQVARLGLESHVELSGGYVPIEEALAAVSAADCGVIPNRPSEINRFALSSKLFEYVALGIPVVVSRLETLAAHFDDHEVTFFEAGDAAALAEAIRFVYDHRDDAEAKAELARRRAEGYSWHRGRALLASLYGCSPDAEIGSHQGSLVTSGTSADRT